MAHGEILQNGVIVVKPDPRLKRAVRTAQQFMGRLASTALSTGGKVLPGVRSLIRQEQMLHWLNRELHDFGTSARYHGKRVYIALDEKILTGVKDLSVLVKDNAKMFVPIEQLKNGMRNAFGLIAREKIHGEWKKKAKRQVQTYGEPWQHRATHGKKR